MTVQPKSIDPDRPWIGDAFRSGKGILVLGESFTGTFEGELQYDDHYMRELLDGKPVEAPELFVKMARKLGVPLEELWQQVMFTNMCLESIGKTNATKVTVGQLSLGRPRLKMLIEKYRPGGVLCLGVKTRDASKPAMNELSVPWRFVYLPSGVNNSNPRTACTPEMLRCAWHELHVAISIAASGRRL